MITEILDNYKSIIDSELAHFLAEGFSKDPVISQNIAFLEKYVMNGGKRLRPIALILAHNLFREENERVLRASLSIELLHTSSLVFDDIMDEDDYRRDSPGVQKLFKDHFLGKYSETQHDGNIFSCSSKRYAASRSMLVGMLAEILSRRVLLTSGFPEKKVSYCLAVLDESFSDLVEGQTLDLEFESMREISEEAYLRMVEKKTACLFAGGMKIGAILGDAGEGDTRYLYRYALDIATAFQIQDDIIDLSGTKGRPPGSDIINGKKTLLAIRALKTAGPSESSELGRILDGCCGKSEVARAIRIIEKSGAIEYARAIAAKKIESAYSAIASMDMGEEQKCMLNDFAGHMLSRSK